jgi:Fur family ferric uptake transcriptional regulator
VKFENGNHFQKEHLRLLLRRRGLKYTRQREAVWSALCSLGSQHPSCQEIYDRSRALAPRLSLATVYRTLRWLRESGMIVERDFGNGFLRVEPGGRKLTHAHLVCQQCGRVMELEERAMESFWKKAAKKYGFEVSRKIVEGYGRCAKCERKTRNGRG